MAGENSTDFAALVEEILENPERLMDESLTAEQILEIQKRMNPYAGIAAQPSGPDRLQVVACSYTNLREDYLRRLTMTSLVGFLFQLFQEWEVPAAQRRWVPASQKRRGAGEAWAAAHAPFDVGRLVERLEATLAIAKEAQAAAQEASAAREAAAVADACLPDEPSEAARARAVARAAAAEDAAARAVGLLYAATHATHQAGTEAGARLRATAEAGLAYPQVKAVLAQHPLPPPPGQIEMPAEVAKGIVGGFLRHWFAFDPSVHVRSGHDAAAVAAAAERARVGGGEALVDRADPGHLTLEAVLAAAPEPAPEHREAVSYILRSRESLAAVAALLRDDDLVEPALAAVENPEAFRHYLLPVPAGSPARPAAETVPPQDTFHRWGYYTEVNYDALRTITEALYPERPDLDWAIAPWAVFEGSRAEVDEAFKKHCERFQDEVPSAIKALQVGQWSLLADFSENRKKIDFYNKHTAVLERILKRHAEDKAIGAELMRNRVRQTKARNIAEDGPDAPGLKAYRRNLSKTGQDLGAQGVERVISPEEMKRLERARGNVKAAKELELLEETERRIADLTERQALLRAAGRELSAGEEEEFARLQRELPAIREMVNVPDDAIQVDVFTNDPASGEFRKSHFYSKSVAPEHIADARAEFERSRTASGHPAAQQLAPYAAEHLASAHQRTPAQQREEAVRDADGAAAAPQ